MSKGKTLRLAIGMLGLLAAVVGVWVGVQAIRTQVFFGPKGGADTGGLASVDGWIVITASLIVGALFTVFCFLPPETSWKIFNWIFKWFK